MTFATDTINYFVYTAVFILCSWSRGNLLNIAQSLLTYWVTVNCKNALTWYMINTLVTLLFGLWLICSQTVNIGLSQILVTFLINYPRQWPVWTFADCHKWHKIFSHNNGKEYPPPPPIHVCVGSFFFCLWGGGGGSRLNLTPHFNTTHLNTGIYSILIQLQAILRQTFCYTNFLFSIWPCVLNSPPEALHHPILKMLHLSSFKTV